MNARWLIGCAVLLLTASIAHAKDYSARRFDVTIRVLERGTLEITETVVFQFEDGTFTFVTREIPLRRTDGIEILSAAMDGRELPFGDRQGQVEITRKSRVRVRWRFAPTAHSTRTFVLKYLARGVVRRDDGSDLLAWTALPREHAYRIASSTIDVTLPVPPLERPIVSTRRASATLSHTSDSVRISASDLRSNGSVELQVRFPSGTVISGPPEWQARQLRAAERGPRWLLAAAGVLASCLVLLVLLRQNYDPPPRDRLPPAGATMPDELPPAVAGTLGSNGRVGMEHAMAALISLADRGEITITAEPRGFLGQREFTITRPPGAAPLGGYEQALVEIVFGSRDGLKNSVKLSSARSRLSLRTRRFARAMEQHLLEHGLMDEARRSVRDRYAWIAAALLIMAGIALAAAIVALRGEHGPWPLAVPAALAAAGIIALIFHAATTALSNDGARRAAAWRAYRRHLRSVARDRRPVAAYDAARLLPFAVAFGLAPAWAKYAERVSASVPPWFQAAMTDPRAFSVFIASAGAGTSGGGGGAAGGGGSGAG